MNSFDSKPEEISRETLEVIEALLKYPSLEKTFDAKQPENFVKTKQRMEAVVVELERVVRRGKQRDAERAKKIAEAFKISLNFLDELDRIRRRQAK